MNNYLKYFVVECFQHLLQKISQISEDGRNLLIMLPLAYTFGLLAFYYFNTLKLRHVYDRCRDIITSVTLL